MWRPEYIDKFGQYFATLYSDTTGDLVKVHPIPFDELREATHAVNRLNARDAGVASSQP